MPPFRKGLLKRKIYSEDPKDSRNEALSKNESLEDSEDLIRGDLDDVNDATDSEHEEDPNNAGSDNEIEKVMFGDDADSTLGDEADLEDSDQSSDLTDSEADTEENDSSDENEVSETTSDSEKSIDSGAESGPSQAQSSDEAEKKSANQKQQKLTTKSLKKKQLQTQKETKSSVDILADKIKNSSVSIQPVEQKDEYSSGDTSDEEDRRNTTGEVPRWWYDEYPHVGYDLDGRRIIKPPQRDQIDEFLKRCEDPDFWRTVKDPSTGQDVKLSKEDLELIHRLREGHVPNSSHDEYQPWIEWFSRSVLATPVRAFPDHKRSFLPSRSEQLQVAKIVHALKMGWTKTRKQLAEERKKKRVIYSLSTQSFTNFEHIVFELIELRAAWLIGRKGHDPLLEHRPSLWME
ncbi:hypothetical protein evm_008990 [Chilo suppressalis]|nr:hypothetical protein evm_008990 [Chilo suppressalis]